MDPMDSEDTDIVAMLQQFVLYDSEYLDENLVKVEFFRLLNDKYKEMIRDRFAASSLQELVDVLLEDYKHYHSGYELSLRFKNYAPRNGDTFMDIRNAMVKLLNEMQVLGFQGKYQCSNYGAT